jgi:DNA recombination protein RmuC
MIIVAVAALLVGAMLGYLVAQLRAARQIEAVRIQLEAARVRLESTARQEADRISLLEQSEARLRASFDSLAGETLRTNSELFLRLARESLGRDQAVAQSVLKERETAIAQLVEPIRAALQKTEAQVESLERERRDAFSTLRTQIETLANGQTLLQRETRNLVTALRRPEVRGRWGELTLRRLVELAGMSEHCDFTEQLNVTSDEGSLRPDLVVHMPESRNLVVDVKAPLDAYLEALEAMTDESRQLALKRHGQQVETRVRQLSSKSYWTQFEHSPEFVVMFLPGDQFLSAALAERPDLLETALKQNVILATPSTLIALLKTVAYGWRQAAVAENAALIRGLGQELYKRLGNFTAHLGKVGQRLGAAIEAYNSAVGSLERQVMPQARRFPELGVTPDAPLAQLEQIDLFPRKVGTAPGGEPVNGEGAALSGEAAAAGGERAASSEGAASSGEAATSSGERAASSESATLSEGAALSGKATASGSEGYALSETSPGTEPTPGSAADAVKSGREASGRRAGRRGGEANG